MISVCPKTEIFGHHIMIKKNEAIVASFCKK